MRIFITGVGCIGKTTIGKKMAELMGCHFFDLDEEIENYFETSIERLQNKFLTIHSFRNEAAKALIHIISQPESENSVIALPPSGLISGYWRVVKKTKGIKLALTDEPENILGRITFFDIDSNSFEKKLSEKEKRLYLKEIKKDISYFGKSFIRADKQVNICGLDIMNAATKLIETAKHIATKE
jgi:shikimate kinase